MPIQIQNAIVPVSPLLTEVAISYSNAQFIGKNLFQEVKVARRSAQIPVFGKEAFKYYDTRRALRADENVLQPGVIGTTTYSCFERSGNLRYDIGELDEAGKQGFNLQANAVTTVKGLIELGKELDIATLAQALTTYDANNQVTLSDNYFNEDSIDPIKEIRIYMQDLADIIGKYPNTMMIPGKVWNFLRNNPEIKSYLSDAQNRVVTVDILKLLLEVPNIFVGNGVYTMPDAPKVFLPIWGNCIILAYVSAPKGINDVFEPNFGYTMQLEGYPQSKTYPNEAGTMINIRTADVYDICVTGADCGFLIDDPIDPAIYTPA